uniref:tetrahydrofolate synthase n=1 Tax=Pipistrellus kuhlii TaxID=59472 RepID=A0A7J7S3T7_PIPKU|nr:folylpolyglutamate synthase [Pipistrellus kuhlii]
MEVGIGGAYDCTNIVRKPVVCGVSALGMDHTSLLGDTMEKIAWQKGGIFKRGVPAFTVPQPDGPLAVLRERAEQVSCPLYLCPPLDALEDGAPPLTLGLEGEHQRSNAALALQLARCWLQRKDRHGIGELRVSRPSLLCQLPLAPVFQPTAPMRHGLRDTEWPGRTQMLCRGPLTWYLDGAHTCSSVQACVRWFRQALQRRKGGPEVRVLLFNSTGDRDGRDPVLQTPSPPRDLLSHPVASSGASVLREAAAVHVLVTGSLHLVGGVLKLLDPSLSQ